VEWFWILLGAILVVRVAVRIARQRRLARSGIYDIDRMDGRTFEHYLRTMFARHGYKVEVTKYRGDFGADLILRRDGSKVAVQAKRASKNVGVRAIQEAVAAKGYYDADTAMVVTNRDYTAQAKVLARKNGVVLCDRERLISMLLKARASEAHSSHAGKAPTPASVAAGPVCVRCGAAVSESVRAYCLSNAERFGGAIYCFPHQRRIRPA
jgi:restriction system protein